MTSRIELAVDPDGGGRLDMLVLELLAEAEGEPSYSRSQIKQWISSGQVSVDGSVVTKAGSIVRAGSKISVVLPEATPSELEPYKIDLSVVYEDDALIVIDKPAGLVMHPGAGTGHCTLVNALVGHFSDAHSSFPDPSRPGIVHRLDKDTSGIVVVAKSVRSHAALSHQFGVRSIGRHYIALALVTPRAKRPIQIEESGTIESRIGRHPTQRKKMAVLEVGGKAAVTHWSRTELFSYGCLLSVSLQTGRTHQIRVHFDYLGSPIIGDPVYGNFAALPEPLMREHQNLGRQALHAASLEFDHPISGKRLSFQSPLPLELNRIIERFRDFGAV